MRKEAGVGEEGRAPTPEGPWAGKATLASGDGTGQLPSPTKQLRAVMLLLSTSMTKCSHTIFLRSGDTWRTKRRGCQGTSCSRSPLPAEAAAALGGGAGCRADSSPEGGVSIWALPTGRGKSSAQRWEMEGRAPLPAPSPVSSDSCWAQHSLPPPRHPCPREWSWGPRSPRQQHRPSFERWPAVGTQHSPFHEAHRSEAEPRPALPVSPARQNSTQGSGPRCQASSGQPPGQPPRDPPGPPTGQAGGWSLPGHVPPPGCLPLPRLGPHSAHSPENHVDCHGPWGGGAGRTSTLAETLAGLSLPDATSVAVPAALALLCLLPS